MKRMRMAVFAATAIVVLVVAAVAVAATLNTYTAVVTAKQSGPGTAKKPVALGLVQKLAASPADGNPTAEPLTDIKLTIPKVTFSAKGFPTCTAAQITKAGTDAGCPKGALIATGPVTAALWSRSNPSSTIPCDPVLDAWNAGGGKVTDFFKIPAGHQCAGLATGAVAPWTGTLKESGGSLVYDTPLPPPVSTNAGNLGLESSLLNETITFSKLTAKVSGKVVPFLASTGCVAGKRPYTVSFTSTNGSISQTSVVKGTGSC